MSRLLALFLSGAALVWLAAVLLSPLALASRRPAAGVPAALVYQTAARICHQRPERSFHLSGIQAPVCARCLGLYAAGALGALAGWAPRRQRERGGGERWVLAIASLPTAFTWALEAAGVAAFSNPVRALAGVPLGLAAGWIFVRGLRSSAIS